MMRATWSVVAAALVVASCTGLDRDDQGNLQPQTVRGPCHIDKFFLVALSTTHTSMIMDNTGEPCVFTMINEDLRTVQDAAFVTTRASHGRVVSGLFALDHSVSVTYLPRPGYYGPDKFNITVQPVARDLTVDVTIRPPGSEPFASAAAMLPAG